MPVQAASRLRAWAFVTLLGCGGGLHSPRERALDSPAPTAPDAPIADASASPVPDAPAVDASDPPVPDAPVVDAETSGPPAPDGPVTEAGGDGAVLASKPFRNGIGDTFDFGAARITVNALTFDQDVRLEVRVVPPPRPGPVTDVYQLRVEPVMRTHVPARVRIRLPDGTNPSAVQLAYFKPKPSPSPGIWLPGVSPSFISEERAWEADLPNFDGGVEHVALLHRCAPGDDCGALLFCVSMSCQ